MNIFNELIKILSTEKHPDVNVSANDFYENINIQVDFMLKLLETQM